MKNRLIKTIALSTILASSTLLANDSLINQMGINLGKSSTDFSQKDKTGSISLGNNPDKSFNSIEVFTILNPLTDICKEYNMKPYASYTYSSNSELKHQYLLVGVNKYYKPSKLPVELYAGVVVGYGQIDWKYKPLSTDNNVDANSLIGGVQAGLNYPLNEKLSLNVNSKYLIHDYKTNLKTSNAQSTIEHDSTATISMGLVYKF